MKKRKINYENIIIALITFISYMVVLHDLYMITIYGWITGNQAQFTTLGMVTSFVAFGIAIFFTCYLSDYVKEQEKKTSATTTKRKSKNL